MSWVRPKTVNGELSYGLWVMIIWSIINKQLLAVENDIMDKLVERICRERERQNGYDKTIKKSKHAASR